MAACLHRFVLSYIGSIAMTDHKTIREALEQSKYYVERYGDSRKDAHYIEQFEEALTALDRIESVVKFTNT